MANKYAGKRKQEQDEDSGFADRPPEIVPYLSAMIMRIRNDMEHKNKRWPDEIPTDCREAAQWWISNQEKPHPVNDAPRQVSCSGSADTSRWETQYHNRIASTFRKYVSLPQDDREMILAAQADGVRWRGDVVREADGSPGIFINIYDQTMKLRDAGSIQAYLKREDIKSFLHRCLKRI